jgi:hypothetical protein
LTAAAAANEQYFPPASLGDTPSEEQYLSDWYSKQLTALHEPSLWQESLRNPGAEVYRFLYLRSFDHPISVRLTVTAEGSGLLTAKETNGQGGFHTGRLIRNTTVRLSKQDTQWFCDRLDLDEVGYWKLPSRQKAEKGMITVDGAQWIVEGAKNGHYKIVDRTSPPVEDPIHWIGIDLMIHLAHLRLLYQDVY